MGKLYDESSNMYFKQNGKKDMNEIYFLSGRKSHKWWILMKTQTEKNVKIWMSNWSNKQPGY